jgi:glycerophosphoryl diester phosphodiesterase
MTRREALHRLAAGTFLAFTSPRAFANSDAPPAVDLLPKGKFLIGHRGACAYAPENTLPSYELALKQGVDYVEQDLQITKDQILVCSHDATLERVTNVADVFPDRFTEEKPKKKKIKRWYIRDFTLKELKQLDFGERFAPKFKGVRIPAWDEAIDLIKGKAGLCPEIKNPEIYTKAGYDFEKLVADALKRAGLSAAKPGTATPVFIQSFSKPSLIKIQGPLGIKWPTLWLAFGGAKATVEVQKEAATFTAAVGPSKPTVTAEMVAEAHALGMKVVAWTFRPGEVKDFKDVTAEMSHYLYELGVDGLFTDNPDLFPRKKV